MLILSLALAAATGFSLQDSQSFDSLPSAFSAVADQTPVEDQLRYARVLQRELEGLVGSSSVSRVRRNALRGPNTYPGCCGSLVVYEYPKEIPTTYPECHPDILHGGEITGEPFNVTVMCLPYQCYAKRIGVVDGEGYVQPDAFVNAVSNMYAEDSLKDLAKKLAPYCVTESNAYAKEMLEASDSGERCNVAPYWAQDCVDVGIIMGCPEDLKINNEQCDGIREEIRLGLEEWKNSTQSK